MSVVEDRQVQQDTTEKRADEDETDLASLENPLPRSRPSPPRRQPGLLVSTPQQAFSGVDFYQRLVILQDRPGHTGQPGPGSLSSSWENCDLMWVYVRGGYLLHISLMPSSSTCTVSARESNREARRSVSTC